MHQPCATAARSPVCTTSRPSEVDEVVDAPLPATRARPTRFYSLLHTGGFLAECVLWVREWFLTGDDAIPPAESVYAVQCDSDPLAWSFAFVRLNPLPRLFVLFDEGDDALERLFTCRVFRDDPTRGACDCKGFRTFGRCTHLQAFSDAVRRTLAPARTSEPAQLSDDELAEHVLGG